MKTFEGSCILKLYHAYLATTKSVTLSVEELLLKKMDTIESYFNGESDGKEDE